MGRDKASLSFRGKSLLEHVVSAVSPRCEPVFVIAAPGQRLPDVDASVLRDQVRGVGPLVATGRGLRAAAEAGCDRAFVCAVDMPLMAGGLIDALSAAADRVNADVVIPWDGRDHFLAAIYRTALCERVDALVAAGERSMSALVNVVDAQRIVLTDSVELTNVNTVEDLAAIDAPATER